MSAPSVVVGRYRLDQLLRPDLHATTWKARDLTAGRDVVVCLVANETGAAARSRLRIYHESLAPVLDVVRVRDGVVPPLAHPDPRGELFVVIDPPIGPSADEIVAKRGAIEPAVSVRAVLAIAEAVRAIHEAGSIHGGITPAAIELRDRDFAGPRLSLRGVDDGALAYASPSRLCDGGPSRHDDAWALLGVLYFLVTGSAPFAAESPQALARRVLGGRPIPLKGTTPEETALQKVFDRGFSRTASARYPDVAALRSDLRAWVSETSGDARAEAPTPAQAYPRLAQPPAPKRNQTLPWGQRLEEIAPSPQSQRSDPRFETERDDEPPTPLAHAVVTSTPPPAPPPEPSPSPPPSLESVEAPREEPAAAVAPEVGRAVPSEETSRFSRDELAILEGERAPRGEEPAPNEAAATPALEPAKEAPPSEPSNETPSPEPAKPASGPPPSVNAVSPPPRRGGRSLAIAFAGGAAVALIVGGVYVALRGKEPAPADPIAAAATNEAAKPIATHDEAKPIATPNDEAKPIATHDEAKPIATASAPVTKDIASAPPPATSAPSSAPRAGDVHACVARFFAEDTFAADQDLSFVCAEASVRAGGRKLQRAIVAGSGGKRVTDAMKEWSAYRWYDAVVYATLHEACCPGAAPVETPRSSGSCSPYGEAVTALAHAAATGASMDEAAKQFRRTVACIAANGDSSMFGQDGPMQGGEDTAFRAFVARGTK